MSDIDQDEESEIRPPDEIRRMRLYSFSSTDEEKNGDDTIPSSPIEFNSMNEIQQMEYAMQMSREMYENEEKIIMDLLRNTKCEYEEKRMCEKQTRFVSLKPKLEKLMKLDKQHSDVYSELLNYIVIYEMDIEVDYIYVSREEYEKIMGILKTMRLNLEMMEYVMDLLRPTE